jgi:hypothetical protein
MGDSPDTPFITKYLFPGSTDSIGNPQFERDLKEWVIINKDGKQKKYTIQKNDWPTVRRRRINVER